MKILVACEESQAVTIAFRKKGHEAYSCDIQECSGGHPEWHIQDDIRNVLRHDIYNSFDCVYDMVIAFPPCTFLTVTGNKWMKPEFKKKFPTREKDREEGINFFMFFASLKNSYVAIENPVGIMSTKYRKPDQIIQPYYFGDEAKKTTCLWLKGLHPLLHHKEDDLFFKKTHVSEGEFHIYSDGRKDPMWHVESLSLPKEQRSKARSKTFPGIAKAMAEQWG